MAEPSSKDPDTVIPTGLSGPAVHVLDRSANSHRKTSSPRSITYKTHSVAPQEQLESTRITRKGHSNTQVPAPPPTMVAGGEQRTPRSTVGPNKTCSADIYRRIKRRVGRSLKQVHCERNLVPSGKQAAYKLPRTQTSFCSLKRVPRPLLRQDSTCSNRQHHSGVIHKQGRRHEVGSTLCPTMENLDLVYQKSSNSQSLTHSRPAEGGSRPAIQVRPDHPNRVVSPSRGFPDNIQQVAPAKNRPFCQEVQQQVVCVTSTGSPGHSSGCTPPITGGSACIHLPTNSHIGQSGGEAAGLLMQENHSDCSGVAQHALVLGLSDYVQPNTTEPAQSAQPAYTTFQSDPSQKSDKLEPPCMAPRGGKEQGFSEAVAERIEAPQRRSTRSVYEAKWSIFTKWCISNQVDFRAPPIKSVADFLMYLFQDRKLQPSTIGGYRSAIADKLDKSPINYTKMKISLVSWDRPKGRRRIPSWNLSLVLHQLTKTPFEPIREASLKHLTFKTVFLLALGLGKRRSEIHAWQNKYIRHQSDWSKVSLYPSPNFLSKNQLAKEGPESVAPVVIPALAETVDRSLKSDRSLCPIKALLYYLDRTLGRIRS